MSTTVVTIGHRLEQLGYHAAYQGKWHLSANIGEAKKPVDASLLTNRKIIDSYGFADFLGVGDLIDGPLGGYSFDNFSTESAVTWLRTKARELKTHGHPWFMAVNLVNPHDVMYINSDAPGETVQGKSAGYPIDRPPQNEIYLAEWDAPLPATRHQPLNAPGRPRAHYEYQATQDIFLGQWPDEDRRWRVLQNYYYNCIRDCDRHLVRLLEELKTNALAGSTIVVFTADHGELRGAHQMRGKGANAYREQQHLPLMILHPAYPGGGSTKALSSQVDLAPTLLRLTGRPAEDIDRAGAGLKGRDLPKVLSAPEQAAIDAVRPAALYNYNMFLYLDAKWFAPFLRIDVSDEPMVEKTPRLVMQQPDFNNRGAIRSIFDGRYRFSRYFSPVHFNRPTTYEALVADNDLEAYDLEQDPQEVHNLAQDSQARDLIMALNAALNARIDEEVGVDDGQVLATARWPLVPDPSLIIRLPRGWLPPILRNVWMSGIPQMEYRVRGSFRHLLFPSCRAAVVGMHVQRMLIATEHREQSTGQAQSSRVIPVGWQASGARPGRCIRDRSLIPSYRPDPAVQRHGRIEQGIAVCGSPVTALTAMLPLLRKFIGVCSATRLTGKAPDAGCTLRKLRDAVCPH